jgi:enamine deaminase RidA (YjgF/YER057c/UK114 family)
MTITRIESGPRMSDVVIHDNTVYLSGVVAERGETVAEQTQDILATIEDLLKQAGSDKRHLLKANIWLVDISTIAEMNRVWDVWVIAGSTPVRATVEARLARPEWKVEIMVEAARIS